MLAGNPNYWSPWNAYPSRTTAKATPRTNTSAPPTFYTVPLRNESQYAHPVYRLNSGTLKKPDIQAGSFLKNERSLINIQHNLKPVSLMQPDNRNKSGNFSQNNAPFNIRNLLSNRAILKSSDGLSTGSGHAQPQRFVIPRKRKPNDNLHYGGNETYFDQLMQSNNLGLKKSKKCSTETMVTMQSTTSKEKVYKCSFCSFTASMQQHLKTHVSAWHNKCPLFQSHIIVKALDVKRCCPLCPFECLSPASVQKHIISTHSKETLPPNKCPWCDFFSISNMSVIEHITSCHKNDTSLCKECVYISGSIGLLKCLYHKNMLQEKLKYLNCLFSPESSYMTYNEKRNASSGSIHKCKCNSHMNDKLYSYDYSGSASLCSQLMFYRSPGNALLVGKETEARTKYYPSTVQRGGSNFPVPLEDFEKLRKSTPLLN